MSRRLGFTARIGGYGSDAPGTFKYPSSAAALPSGEVVVTDSWNSRLQVMNIDVRTGAMNMAAVHNFEAGMEPYGIAVTSEGRIFVSVCGFGATPHGLFEFSWGESDPMKPPEPEAKGKKKAAPDAKEAKGNGKEAVAAALSKSKPQLWAVSFLGGKVGTKEGAFAFPCGLATHTPSGCILVADSGNHRIVAVKPSSNVGGQLSWVSSFGGEGSGDEQFNSPRGVATDPNGMVYVADTMNGRVVVRSYDKGAAAFPFLAVAAGRGCAQAGGLSVGAPWDVCVEPLEVEAGGEAGGDAETGARKPWSNRLTVSDHGPATHGLHALVVNLTETAAAGAPTDGEAHPVALAVALRSDGVVASYGAGTSGSAPGCLDCPRGVVVLPRGEEGRCTLVVDCQNNSLVLLTPLAEEEV